MPEDVIENYADLVNRLHEALMKVKVKELNKTGEGAEAVQMRLRFMREAVKTDAAKNWNIAELLVQRAELHAEEGDLDDAAVSLQGAIEVLEKYGNEHNDSTALERADEIRELKQSFEET